MTHGERLTVLRENKGLSQYKLAQMAGIKQQVISNYETGKRNPGLATLQKVCPALGVSVAEFLLPEPFDEIESGEIVLYEQKDTLAYEISDLTEQEKKEVADFIRFKKSQRNK